MGGCLGGTFDFRVTQNPNFMLDVNLDEEFDNIYLIHEQNVALTVLTYFQNCRLTYRILLKFDGRYMTPKSLHHYQDWSSLNYMYGVVNISYHEDHKLIAHLEFEPGLYTNHQMKVGQNKPIFMLSQLKT